MEADLPGPEPRPPTGSGDPALPNLAVPLDYVPVRSPDVAELEAGEGLVLYDEGTDLIHQLNPSAGIIWRLCDGTATVGELADEIADEYALGVAKVRRQVARLVGEFDALGLVWHADDGSADA